MRSALALLLLASFSLCRPASAAEQAEWTFETKPDRLVILQAGKPACEYVFVDEKVKRPYFCRVLAPGGVPVTRSHPPLEGRDPADHADMHPGIWLGFGDLNGVDFWRNKGAVKHQRFTQEPVAKGRTLAFSVENHYQNGDRLIATERCTHSLVQRDGGYFVTFDSTFVGNDGLVFGDQEEMGLGIRVASPLRVTGGKGQIVDSESRRNEQQIWGKSAKWCDYRAEIDGKSVGLAVLTHPDNFRPSWLHVRDYGLLVANPFGRKALTGGEASRVEIPAKEPLRLRFAVLVHAAAGSDAPMLADAYREYLE